MFTELAKYDDRVGTDYCTPFCIFCGKNYSSLADSAMYEILYTLYHIYNKDTGVEDLREVIIMKQDIMTAATEYVVFDLEWNRPPTRYRSKKNGVKLNGEIVQIGAIKLN